MDISQIGIKKFLSFLSVVLLSQNLFAQNFDYRYEIDVKDQEYLQVKITALKAVDLPMSFKFPESIPNYYLPETILNEISDFEISKQAQKTKLNILQNKVEINQDFDFISYKVKFKKCLENDFPAVQTFSQQDYSIINFANFLGGFSNSKVELSLKQQQQLVFIEVDVLESFYEKPFCIGCNKNSFKDDSVSINYYTNHSEKELPEYIVQALNVYKLLGFEEKLENKNMIFIIDSINNNEGAIAHKNHIVFKFKKVDKFQIQKTILHEMIHWLVSDLNSWLNESVAEFLAIKLMMKSALISDERFLEIMSEKIKSAEFYKNTSLESLYRNNTSFSDKQNYQALYSKGAVLAWILDAKLFDNPYFEISLEEYILNGILSKNEANKIEFIEDIIQFEKSYVTENNSISYNKFLNSLGILYEENKILEIKAKQNILLTKEEDKIIIVDNGGINELKENDVLLKLNRAKKIEQIKEQLKDNSEKSSCFVILRNGVKKKFKISNKESLFIRSKFNLSFVEKRTKDQIANWEKYIY